MRAYAVAAALFITANVAHAAELHALITTAMKDAVDELVPTEAVQKLVTTAIENYAPRMISAAFDWEAYRAVDISISLTAWGA